MENKSAHNPFAPKKSTQTRPVNPSKASFVDSHVHLDRIFAENRERISWLRDAGCLVISWAFGDGIASVSDLKDYLYLKKDTIHRINKTGLPCFYLAGIHPRNVPPDLKPETIKDILAPYLDDPLCLGIGEIGLENGSYQEKEVLSAQLAMAHDVTGRDKVFGIHTPRENKVQITAEILTIIEQFPEYYNSIVVDHCTLETAGKVIAMGLWAGVTLSPIKTSSEELHQIIAENPSHQDRIMLNTDSGNIFYEDLYRFYHSEDCPVDLRTKLVEDNALRFYREAMERYKIG
jgi:predicted metal-dependent TIM-barrel fold hydrolase